MLISKYCLFVDFDAVQIIFFLNAHLTLTFKVKFF